MLKNNFLDNSVQDKTNITVVMKTKTPSWCQKLDVSWKSDWPLESGVCAESFVIMWKESRTCISTDNNLCAVQ